MDFSFIFAATVFVLDLVYGLEAGLIVSTGDLFDRDLDSLHPCGCLLFEPKADNGKIAITGNYEYYTNFDQTLQMTRDSGFTLVQNATLQIDENLHLAGIGRTEVCSY